LPEAVRFYHNALYAPWGTDQAAARRLLRAELIRFLLDNRQRRAAQSELLALSADLPEEAAPHTETGELFARAGDDRHALDQFQRALRIAPDDASALAGAGQAAFALGDYVQARKYLAFAPGNAQGVAATREIVEEILLRDPLAGRMPNTQRERRLRANLAYLRGRLDACVAQRAGAEGAPELAGLRDAVNVFEADLARTRDRDAIESGVELSDTIASQVAQSCPPATAVDQALVLIGRRHGAAER
jgi:tetratricopeptide (TPR) repeat protein